MKAKYSFNVLKAFMEEVKLLQVFFLGLCILVVLFFILIVSKSVYKETFNPVSIYSCMWLLCTFVALFKLWGMYQVSESTVFYILLNVISFSIISIISYLKFSNSIKSSYIVTPKNVGGNAFGKERILIIVNILAVLWLMQFVIKQFPYIAAGNWETARYFYLNANINDTIFNTRQSLYCQWIVFPIFYVTTIIAAYYIAKGKINKKLLVLSIIGIAMNVLATAGRNALFKMIMFFVLAFLVQTGHHYRVWKRIKESGFFIKLLLVAGIGVLIFITSQRSMSGNTSVLQNVVYYFIGPIIYLDQIFQNPEKFVLLGDPLFGRATFGFISTPIEIFISIVGGKNYAGADNIITSYVNQYYSFSGTIQGNAVSTALYPFIRDFGMAGIVLGPSIFAVIVNFVYAKAKYMVNGKSSIFWKCLAIYMLYTVFFSEWEYELLFPQSFSIMLFLYLLTKGLGR